MYTEAGRWDHTWDNQLYSRGIRRRGYGEPCRLTMPKLFPPALLLQHSNIRDFCLQAQITDIETLKHHLQHSVCLGIDMEGCEGIREGITSLGLAVLPPTKLSDLQSTALFPSLPFRTQDLVDRCKIESYFIYIQYRSRKKSYASFPYGHVIKTAKKRCRERDTKYH